jgi:hypothetical protein
MSRSTTGWASPPAQGRPAKLSDAELLTLAVAQVLLGVRSEARWLRFVPRALPAAFPYLPGQSGYNKRLRAAGSLIRRLIRELAADTDLWTDPVWITDSTPVECARSRPTARRSNLAGWAGYSYCPSHSRWFWGLRLHLVCTPSGLPITWALADPTAMPQCSPTAPERYIERGQRPGPSRSAQRPPRLFGRPLRAQAEQLVQHTVDRDRDIRRRGERNDEQELGTPLPVRWAPRSVVIPPVRHHPVRRVLTVLGVIHMLSVRAGPFIPQLPTA